MITGRLEMLRSCRRLLIKVPNLLLYKLESWSDVSLSPWNQSRARIFPPPFEEAFALSTSLLYNTVPRPHCAILVPPIAQGTRPMLPKVGTLAKISLAKGIPGPIPHVFKTSISWWRGSWARTQVLFAFSRWILLLGAHSEGILPSHLTMLLVSLWLPPRPDMLLCPPNRNMFLG